MVACKNHTLTLRQIAAWQFPELVDKDPNQMPILAGLPSLQRGAVWDAAQVELLWDSILRGFPIGSIVVCEKLEAQATRSGIYGNGWMRDQISHHLLDGQQRCNAIALGFLDPIGGYNPPAALWIDLNPEFSTGSTREFLFRMLTESHPWGFKKSDKEESLDVADIRAAVEKYPSKKRPAITEAWPYASKAAIPFAWLTTTALVGNQDAGEMWKNVLEKLGKYCGLAWADAAAKCVGDRLAGNTTKHLIRVECGLRYAKEFVMAYLEVPSTALRELGRRGEAGEQGMSGGEGRIYNVEHLFQRLNSAGTELRGEELLFSMIKAYWPKIEQSFGAIRDKKGNKSMPMPGSRLAILSARAALINEGKTELPPAISVAGLRKLKYESDVKDQQRQILQYLGIDRDEVAGSDLQNSDLHRNLRQIDEWLLFDHTIDNIGIPPALRSSLAQGSPEVFLLLFHLAQKAHRSLKSREIITLRKPILGLITTLHWFGDNRAKAVGNLYKNVFCKAPLSTSTFSGVLTHCLEADGEREILKLLKPQELDKEVPSLDNKEVEDEHKWRLYYRVVPPKEDEAKQALLLRDKWSFVERVRGCKALLLFAQRDYFSREFMNYDPSCVDIWKGYNRPWDYDHILPSATLSNNQGLRKQCKEWANTIGNFRAWPLEKNRSRQDGVANKAILLNEYDDSVILDKKECDAFSLSWDDIRDRSKVAGFMNAARGRMIRIYKDWFDSLEIAKLLYRS